jgi:CubicO group peptidase (beta-lactamase class C family)
LIVTGILIMGGAAVFVWLLSAAMPIGTGYVAKYLCTSTFVSQRDPVRTFDEDVRPVNPLARFVRWTVDPKRKMVKASAFAVFRSEALYRDGCGCTLLAGEPEVVLRQQRFHYSDLPPASEHSSALPWPVGRAVVDPAGMGVDTDRLKRALDAAFAEPRPDSPRKTRAVAVVFDGKLIAERYAPGFQADMPLLGWSMSKSITNALVGILVRQGRLMIQDPAPVPEWQAADDARRAITLDQLLRMSSGLAFEEIYRPLADATDMLYGARDFGAFAAASPLEADPGKKWNYSSGTANIIARIVRMEAEKDGLNYYDFIRRELFHRIGMTSAVLEADPSGTFVGSSYAVATVRDWARFGLLYLNDGVWNGRRVLPDGWVRYTTTPTPDAPQGKYGALFWLNAGAPGNAADRMWPHAPADAYAAQGFQEQKVIVIPSKKLVLVRFGATADRPAWDTDAFIADVIRSLPH